MLLKKSAAMYLLVFAIVALILLSGYQAVISKTDRASWLQVAIEALALPVVVYQLIRIRKALEEKPILHIGVASIDDLPLSNIREQPEISKRISIGRGYPFFMLIIKNTGRAIAKSVKMHFEYRPPAERHLLTPVIKTYEWKQDKGYSFSQKNNVDFVFIGGQDWVVHPGDFETFGFFMTTVVVKQKDPHEVRERPEPGVYEFHCSVRAEGLREPIGEMLFVEIVDK